MPKSEVERKMEELSFVALGRRLVERLQQKRNADQNFKEDGDEFEELKFKKWKLERR